MPITNKIPESFDASEGSVSIPSLNYHHSITQLSFVSENNTGEIHVAIKTHPKGDYEPLLEDDGVSKVVLDLEYPKTVRVVGVYIHSFLFTPVGVTGSYTPLVSSSEGV